MKKLNNRVKKQINAYIDNELNEEDNFHIERLINKNQEAKKFYDEIINLKQDITFEKNIKASPSFETELFDKISNLKSKRNKFAIINKFFDSITMQKLSYAGATLVFLFFFGFGIFSVFNKKQNAQSTANLSTQNNGQRVQVNEQPRVAITRKSIPKQVREQRTRRVEATTPDNRSERTVRAESDNENQRRTRELFNQLERNNSQSQTVASVKYNLNRGVQHFYNKNYNLSRKHLQFVLDRANRNSVHYKVANDYLQRLNNR